MKSSSTPSAGLSIALVIVIVLVWGWLRLVVFHDAVLPLTFLLPMLVCVWTRRTWQLWGMAAVFVAMAIVDVCWILPPELLSGPADWVFLWTTIFNITAGGAVVHWIIRLRLDLDRRNAELEAQAEELAQQNEEIKTQAEELAQQNEEIEAQAEELAGQNEELHTTNERLGTREEILQGLLESTRTPQSGLQALQDVCGRALHALGDPAECVAILRIDPDRLRVKTQAGDAGGLRVPDEWPLEGTLAQVVLKERRSAYVSDLTQRPELAAPFGPESGVRTVLATPMRVVGADYGVVLACSRRPGHWSQEQFRIIEWLAAQCGLITEGIRWQKALVARAQEVEAANRAKDHFLAMLSHELRTPLTPVLAAAGELEKDVRLPEEVRQDLRMIRRNVAIQSRLVDDLLDLTRLGRGKLELEVQPVELGTLLRETTSIVAPEIDARQQRLAVELTAAEGCIVHGDGPRLQQVFWNLLKNAVKFSPSGARIRLTARRVDGAPRIAVEVADEGIGIDPAHLAKIFEPFEQVAARGKQRGSDGGLGLGLAIAKAIVELHQGTIRVFSDGVGRGARFGVELPVISAVDTAAGRGAASRAPFDGPEPAGRALRILLVEDHGDTRRVLARLLRNAGHAVEAAEHAAAALELFARQPFDLLISDLGLPDESGLELMRKLRAAKPGLTGICLSGYGMEDDREACRAAGFSEHLTKPVDRQRLLAAIARTRASVNAVE